MSKAIIGPWPAAIRRNAAMPGGSPLLNVRWQVKDAEDPDLFDEIGKVHKQFIDSGRPVIPAVQPLAVGDYVLVRTPLRLYGIEFGTQAGDGGRLIWKFPTEANAEAPPKNPGRDVGFMHAVTERIFENNTYGTMSSDGELVFMVNEGNLQQTMRGTPMRNNRVVWGPNGQMVQNAGPAAQNILTAHSLRGEGKLIWQIGEEDGSLPDLRKPIFSVRRCRWVDSSMCWPKVKNESAWWRWRRRRASCCGRSRCATWNWT